MKARRWLAALLAGTMVLGSVASVSAETLSGTSWWEDYQVGEHTAVSGDGSWSYTIHADELVDGYGAFVVEMFDNADEDGNVTDDSRYLTTTSDRDAWTANDPAGNMDTASDGSSGLPDAGDFVIEITREGQDFRVEYYNLVDDGATAEKFYVVTMTDTNFGETVYWRVMAHVGTFTISDLTEGHPVTDNDSISINDNTASPLPVSGQDGDLYWSIDESGLLTITGDGDYVQYSACYNEEEDYYYDDTYADWRDYSRWITSAYVDVTGITSMEAMFEGCGWLGTVTFSENTDTSHVTTMAAMFQNCDALVSVDLTYVDTSSVTYMGALFNGCYNLTSVDVSGFDTSNVTCMGQMFGGCEHLTSIDLSNFDATNVNDMYQMFQGCSGLVSLDLSNFADSQVHNMEFLLNGCSSLNELVIPAGFGANYADIFIEDPYSEGCGAVVNLPSTENYYWVNADGETVTTISLGLDTAVTYTRIRETITGTSGDLSWEIDPNGVLTITGTGDYEQGTTSAEYSATPNWWNYREYITSAVVNVSGITSTECMFFECYNMTSIDVTGLDMSSVTTMRSMFDACNSLTEITGINNWDVSNVKDAAIMFWGNLALTSIDLSGWDTSAFENISQMFEGSTSLTSVDISGWDTSNVTESWSMFNGDTALTEVQIPANFVPQCWGVDLPYQYGCYWVNSNGETVDYISAGTESALTYTRCGEPIETISGYSWWEDYTVEESGTISDGTYSYVFTVVDTYGNCGFVVEVSDADNNYYITTTAGGDSWTANNLDDGANLGDVSASGMMNYSYQSDGKYVVEITKSGSELTFDYYQINGSEAFLFMTYTATGAEVFDDELNLRFMAQIGQFALDYQTGSYISDNSLTVTDTLNGTAGDLSWSLAKDGTLTISGSGDYVSYNDEYGYFENTYASWRNYSSCVSKVVVNVTDITYTRQMFDGMYNMTEIDLSGLDISNITDMCAMFEDCRSLTSIDVGDWDTSNVTDMSRLFDNCISLTSLDVSNWDISNVTDMYAMFENCSSLTSLDVSNWDTSNVESMQGMFCNCSSLKSIDVSNWNTSKNVNAGSMFSNCTSLQSVDVSDWNTSNVWTLAEMFLNCSSLESVDVSDWDTSSLENMADMFNGCTSLTSVDVSGFVTSNVWNAGMMFMNCESLTSVDVSSWDTSGIRYIDYMFANCSSLTSLDVSNFVLSDTIYAEGFVDGCTSLTLLKVPASFGYWKTESSDEEYDDATSAVTGSSITDDSDDSEALVTVDGLSADSGSTWMAISLPSVDGYYWANANAQTVTEIDPNLDSEMWYIRYADGETAEVVEMVDETESTVDLSNATVEITLATTSYTYDGSAKTPAVSSVTCDGVALTAGTDYTVSYSDNTNAGTAKVTITGCGNYSGTADTTFTISKASQTITATAAASSITYGKTTKITASTTGDGALSYSSSNTSVATVSGSGTSATVTAKGAGTATITVTAAATSNYNKATKTITITVTRASQTLSVSSSSVTLAVGKSSTPTVSGAKTTLTYKSSNTSVATVNSSGKITAKKVGTVTITVTAAQTNQYSKATKTITVKVKPASTTVTSVENTTSGVKITWKKVTGASGYYVYRATSKNGTYTQIAKITSGSTVTYTNKSTGTNKVTSGKTYYYKVSAYASTGTATKSSAKSVKYLTAGKISSLTNTSKGITVKWSKVSGASGYYVYRKTSSGSYSKVKTIKSASTVSWTDTGVKSKNGTTYTYKVVPYSGSYTGSFTAAKTVRMTAVSISSVKNSSSKKMTVKWSKNSKSSGYEIQYSTSSKFSSGNKKVTVSGASSSSRVIGSLTKNKTYYVRIRTYKTLNGEKQYSAWSSTKSVKISK